MPISRRAALWAGAGLVAAGAGVAAGVLLPAGSTTRDEQPPAALADALAAEQRLVALTAGPAPGGLAGPVALAHADHQAHLAALQSLRARYGGASDSPSAPPPTTAAPTTADGFHAAEAGAATTAAVRAQAATGTLAGLLASIAACEATHAALFT